MVVLQREGMSPTTLSYNKGAPRGLLVLNRMLLRVEQNLTMGQWIIVGIVTLGKVPGKSALGVVMEFRVNQEK